jgi:hypothetical protein
MRKIISLFILSLLALPLSATEKNNDLDVSLASAHYSFKMPKLDLPVEQKGTLNGVNVSYTRHNVLSEYFDNENDVFVSVQGQYLSGKVDQTNGLWDGISDEGFPLSLKDVKINHWDVRILAGQAYTFKDDLWRLAPYMGIGYNYLSMKPGAWWGYTQSYHKMKGLYIPLGATFGFQPSQRVKITLGGEFDALVHGNYTIDTSDLAPYMPITVDGITFDQLSNARGDQHGYGFRLNARAEIGYKYLSVFVEPFFNYMRTSRSGKAEIMRTSTPDADNVYWYMYDRIPPTVTKEYGLRAGVAF